MSFLFGKWVILVLLLAQFCDGQVCKSPGEYCNDTYMCCGGCCIDKICINTTKDCKRYENPCLIHYCPPGTDCVIFKPKDCPGCEEQRLCSFIGNNDYQ